MYIPENYHEVIKGYRLRRNLILILNTAIVLTVILIFMMSFPPGVSGRLFIITCPNCGVKGEV
ncbi:MAG: hypothetical protein J7L88_04730 [Thermoplasmata archaeon]|nr:hypothetical protein [Thermoplasmata archaeon]